MKALHKGFAAAAILSALAVGGTIVSGDAWADRGGDGGGRCACSEREGGWKGHGHRGDRLEKALGLSQEQKEQIHAIFLKHKDEIAPLRKEMVTEKRELRSLLRSDKTDEAAIREQTKKLAATGGDLAVRRAKEFQEVRAVLTPEQIQKFRALQERRDQRIDRMMDRGKERRSNGE